MFVSRLVALTAFIQTLFSKQIVISSDGSISSKKFTSGSEGFRIQGNGTAEFNNGIFNKGTFDGITVNKGTFNDIQINNTQNIFKNTIYGEWTFTDFLKSIASKSGISCFGSLVATFADSNTEDAAAEFKTLLFWPDSFIFDKGRKAYLQGNFILLDEKNKKIYDEDDDYHYELLYYIPMICRGHLYIATDSAQLVFNHYPTSPEGAPSISYKTININLKKQNYITCRLCY